VWSPDGTRIAFVSNQDGDWEICVLDLNTRERQQLTFNKVWDSFPDWSPDGTWLVFTSRRTGNYDLFVVDAETGEELQLTNSPYSDAHPAWSPYGDEIVYTMVVAEGNNLLREIGVLNLYDLANPRRLTVSDGSKALHRYPDWSPDGRWVLFESGRDGDEEIYIIPARGGIMANITNAPESGDSAPAWSR
jgi:Tol biopolymer transport system component